MSQRRNIKKLRNMRAKVRRQGRLWVPGDPEPYIVGAIDPVTGRPQGENIDEFEPETRDRLRIPPGMTNTEFRAENRKMMTELGLPPVGNVSELTEEELEKLMRLIDYDENRNDLALPINTWHLPPGYREPCTAWFNQALRGEITREEYNRKVLELAGLPPIEPSSSGEAEGATAAGGQPAEEQKA